MNYLFIDRDGTLIREPEDFQIDSLEKLEILPQVITSLNKLKLHFKFVMISNQDGLGTDSFSQENFNCVQDRFIRLLENEGIKFEAILICPHKPEEKCDCRKPKTKLIIDYLYATDIKLNKSASFVLGDRDSDEELANNLGISFIKIDQDRTNSWIEATATLLKSRRATINRSTAETEINVSVNLDGNGKSEVETGLAFFDHMLDQIAVHSGIDLTISARGDLEVDAHHVIEDVAICLGQVFIQALGYKTGIERYAFLLPMDETESQISLDLCNRFYFKFSGQFERVEINQFPTEMVSHFFKSLAEAMKINLHMSVIGENDHHKIESLFKGFARCFKQAIKQESEQIPSSKATL